MKTNTETRPATYRASGLEKPDMTKQTTAKINVYRAGGEWYGARWIGGEYDGCDSLGIDDDATEDDAIETARTMPLGQAQAITERVVCRVDDLE